MNVLVFNAGSSSLKFKLFKVQAIDPAQIEALGPGELQSFEPRMSIVARGLVERVGTGDARLSFERIDSCGVGGAGEAAGAAYERAVDASDSDEALSVALSALTEGDDPAIPSFEGIDAVGHRVAHGGDAFACSVVVDNDVTAKIERFSELAPLHNPSALAVLRRCEELLPHALQVTAFDTAFHQTMPARNYVYPIPYRYYEQDGIRRFGFHGMSHKYVSRRAAEFLGKSPRDLKMITCHLGAGASLTAIDHGVSMDTTMGYTPLDGIMMNTRSGSVDPAIITAIMEKDGLTPAELDHVLNRESGLLGVSGVSGDLRELKEVIKYGDERAELAYDIFLTSIRRMIGAYFFELAGVDVIVCTAGVGENDSYARRLIFRGLEPFGIRIDQQRNMASGREERRISTDDSTVDVLVIPTDEEAEIARDVALIAAGVDISDPYA